MSEQFLLDILNLIEKGYNPSKICVQLNLSKQSLNYHLAKLKKENLIKKVGYGVWEINKVKSLINQTQAQPQQVKNIRGHAFIWKVRFNKQFNWKEILESKQINYDEMGIKNTPRIILDNKKIWLGKKNVIIYFNKKDSFFAFNSIESKKLAVYSLLQTVSLLSNTLGIPPVKYKFTSAREHYSLIQNCLAMQCDKENNKINIKNEEGYWMSIDNSLNLHEAEAVGNNSLLDITGIKKYFNEHKETKFEVTPKFVLNAINKVTNNQIMFAENIESHIKAIQDLGNAVNELTKIVKELKNAS